MWGSWSGWVLVLKGEIWGCLRGYVGWAIDFRSAATRRAECAAHAFCVSHYRYPRLPSCHNRQRFGISVPSSLHDGYDEPESAIMLIIIEKSALPSCYRSHTFPSVVS